MSALIAGNESAHKDQWSVMLSNEANSHPAEFERCPSSNLPVAGTHGTCCKMFLLVLVNLLQNKGQPGEHAWSVVWPTSLIQAKSRKRKSDLIKPKFYKVYPNAHGKS